MDFLIAKLYTKRGLIRKAAIRQREVKHVPAYSDSDRWVETGRARGSAWVGAGEFSWSQGVCNLRCGAVFRNDRTVSRSRRKICRAAQGAGRYHVGPRGK